MKFVLRAFFSFVPIDPVLGIDFPRKLLVEEVVTFFLSKIRVQIASTQSENVYWYENSGTIIKLSILLVRDDKKRERKCKNKYCLIETKNKTVDTFVFKSDSVMQFYSWIFYFVRSRFVIKKGKKSRWELNPK